MAVQKLIDIRGLSKIYEGDGEPIIAIDDIDLSIDEGEYLAIIGPSGSGKSTLLQVLGWLDRPTSGFYKFSGREVTIMSDEELASIRNSQIGFVFQSFNLLPRQSILENVVLPLVYAGINDSERTKIAKDFIELVGLAERAEQKTSKLSGGQKQRVAIARALVNSPKIILADEPTGSLDSKSGATILDFLDDLHAKGNTIIIVTHESYVAERARRILNIKDGRIEKDQIVKDGFGTRRGELLK